MELKVFRKSILMLVLLSGCNHTPSTPKVKVVEKDYSPERCYMIMQSYCAAVVRCQPGKVTQDQCEMQLAPTCADVSGIDDTETVVCMAALDNVTCDGEFPRVCLGIAGPKEEP